MWARLDFATCTTADLGTADGSSQEPTNDSIGHLALHLFSGWSLFINRDRDSSDQAQKRAITWHRALLDGAIPRQSNVLGARTLRAFRFSKPRFLGAPQDWRA